VAWLLPHSFVIGVPAGLYSQPTPVIVRIEPVRVKAGDSDGSNVTRRFAAHLATAIIA